MHSTNLERLIKLADEVFATKSDPHQLDINPRVMKRLKQIHPATISEYADANGPVCWVLVIPTTLELMNQFLNDEITERELFNLTPVNSSYEALYLCSALTLIEYRRKGIVKQLTIEAITKIRKDYPLKALFVWPFSSEGNLGAETIAQLTNLPLYKRSEHK
jgi:hypothetical protein